MKIKKSLTLLDEERARNLAAREKAKQINDNFDRLESFEKEDEQKLSTTESDSVIP